MGANRRLRRKMQKESKSDAGRIVAIFDKFIESKYLVVDTEKYLVSMLKELWQLYDSEEKRKNFVSNLKFYCDIMNAYHSKAVDPDAVLFVSLKDENDNVKPAFYYKYGVITAV